MTASTTSITLTEVPRRQAADIVVHYVPTAGGGGVGGYAICGDHGCPNILVRSDLPPSLDRDPYDPEYRARVASDPSPAPPPGPTMAGSAADARGLP